LEALGGDQQPWLLHLRHRQSEIKHLLKKAAGQLDIFAFVSESHRSSGAMARSISSSGGSSGSITTSNSGSPMRIQSRSPSRSMIRRMSSSSITSSNSNSNSNSMPTDDNSSRRIAAMIRVCEIATQQLSMYVSDSTAFIERQREKQATPELEQEALLLVGSLASDLASMIEQLLFPGRIQQQQQQPQHQGQQLLLQVPTTSTNTQEYEITLALSSDCVMHVLGCYGSLISDSDKDIKRNERDRAYSTLQINHTSGSGVGSAVPSKLVRDKLQDVRNISDRVVQEYVKQLRAQVVSRMLPLLHADLALH
jgi:hypothetical protein